VSPGQDIPTPDGSPIFGRIAGKGLSDELAGRYYAVIETPSGVGYHVPLSARAAEALRPGDLVALESAPERGNASNSAPERRNVAVRKQALDLEDQVRRRGPVPLDRLEGDTLAPNGFGHEVRRARERREATLRYLGIDPADPQRDVKLGELERRDIGAAFAQRSGARFLADTPERFQGRVEVLERGDGTAPYAVVSDGVRCVVVEARNDLLRRRGQAVFLSQDPSGGLRVDAMDHDLGR
jgi:hypothetical protein